MISDSTDELTNTGKKVHYHQVHCLQTGKQKRECHAKLKFRLAVISVWLKIIKDE